MQYLSGIFFFIFQFSALSFLFMKHSVLSQLSLVGPTESEAVAALDVHPRVLCFQFKAGGERRCLLNITNRSDGHHVGFWIETPRAISAGTKFGGIVSPLNTCVFVMSLKGLPNDPPPVDTGVVKIWTLTMSKMLVDDLSSKGIIDNEGLFAPQSPSQLPLLEYISKSAEGKRLHETVLTAVICPSSVGKVCACHITSFKLIEARPRGDSGDLI
jgi:hypothetical protein